MAGGRESLGLGGQESDAPKGWGLSRGSAHAGAPPSCRDPAVSSLCPLGCDAHRQHPRTHHLPPVPRLSPGHPICLCQTLLPSRECLRELGPGPERRGGGSGGGLEDASPHFTDGDSRDRPTQEGEEPGFEPDFSNSESTLYHRGRVSGVFPGERKSSDFGPGPSALLAAATMLRCVLQSVCYLPARLWARGEWVGVWLLWGFPASVSTGYGPTLGPGAGLRVTVPPGPTDTGCPHTPPRRAFSENGQRILSYGCG